MQVFSDERQTGGRCLRLAGRPRLYKDAADKQAAYRRRSDYGQVCRNIAGHLRVLAKGGDVVRLDPIALTCDASVSEVMRRLDIVLRHERSIG
jgi:hypothetical protein